jgi:hypothetical protein
MGLDPNDPVPDYKVWAAPGRPRAMVNLRASDGSPIINREPARND